MPENPPEAETSDDSAALGAAETPDDSAALGAAETPADAADEHARQTLDVPEWVSELRRLYVEPKTRAELRQARGLGLQRRKLGLPRGRGSSQPAPPAAPETPGEAPSPLEAIAAGQHPDLPRPDHPEGRLVPGPGASSAAAASTPDRPDEDTAASWLTSYLAATGHSAEPDEDEVAASAEESVTAASTPPAVQPAPWEGETAPQVEEPAPVGPSDPEPDVEVPGVTPPDVAADESPISDVQESEPTAAGGQMWPGGDDSDLGSEREPGQEAEPEHHRSLAELAGLGAVAASGESGTPDATERLAAEGNLPDEPPVSQQPVTWAAAEAGGPQPQPVFAVDEPDSSAAEGNSATPVEHEPPVEVEAAEAASTEANDESRPSEALEGIHVTPGEQGRLHEQAAREEDETTPTLPTSSDEEQGPQVAPEQQERLAEPVSPNAEAAPPSRPAEQTLVSPEAVEDSPVAAEEQDLPETESSDAEAASPSPPAEQTLVSPEAVEGGSDAPEEQDLPVEPTAPVDAEAAVVASTPMGDENVPLGVPESTPAEPVEQELAGPGTPDTPDVERAPSSVGHEPDSVGAPEESPAAPEDTATPAPSPGERVPSPAAPAEETPRVGRFAPRTPRHGESPPPSPEPEPYEVASSLAGEDLTAQPEGLPEPPPSRPSSTPRVTLSWREAEAFDLGLPSVEDDQEAIVVEPPSQLVAKPRRRRPEPVVYDDEDDDAWDEPSTPEHEPTPPVEEAQPSAGEPEAGTTSRPGRTRRVVAVVLLLVVLAVVAWYFLLRDSGDGSAAPRPGGAGVVASGTAPSAPGLHTS